MTATAPGPPMAATVVPELRTRARGRFRQFEGDPEARLYGCRVSKPPYLKNGKVYCGLDLEDARGDFGVLQKVDAHVAAAAGGEGYSPVTFGGGPGGRPTGVLVKLANVKWENVDGDPAAPWQLLTNARVDVVLRPGAYGAFGYCWLLHRVKPSAAVLQAAVGSSSE